MWIKNIKRQYQKLSKGIRFLKKLVGKSERQIKEFGLISNVIFVESSIMKSSPISTKSIATSADINATANIAKRLCLLMNNLLGEEASLALLKLAEETNNIKNGEKKYSSVMGINVFGVEEIKGWKLTTLKDGVNSQNFGILLKTEELSV